MSTRPCESGWLRPVVEFRLSWPAKLTQILGIKTSLAWFDDNADWRNEGNIEIVNIYLMFGPQYILFRGPLKEKSISTTLKKRWAIPGLFFHLFLFFLTAQILKKCLIVSWDRTLIIRAVGESADRHYTTTTAQGQYLYNMGLSQPIFGLILFSWQTGEIFNWLIMFHQDK